MKDLDIEKMDTTVCIVKAPPEIKSPKLLERVKNMQSFAQTAVTPRTEYSKETKNILTIL